MWNVLWVIWDTKFDGDIHFLVLFEEKSMPGQVIPNFQMHFPQIHISCAVLPQVPKNAVLFCRATI